MPFYLATPRRGTSQTQGGGVGNVDYQRTIPSQFIIYMISSVSMAFSLFIAYMPFAVQLVNRFLSDNVANLRAPFPRPYVRKLSDCIPVRYPNVILVFKSRPSSEIQEMLDEWGIEAERIANIRKDVFMIRSPDVDQLREIVNFTGLDDSIRPPNDFITPAAIPSLFHIINMISSIAECLEAYRLSAFDIIADGTTKPGFREHTLFNLNVPDVDAPMAAEGEEEGEVEEPLRTASLRFSDHYPEFAFQNASYNRSVPWGRVEDFLAKNVGGILVPFEQNYVAPDPFAVQQLYSNPWHVLTDEDDQDELDRIMAHWAQQIASTTCGMVLAHMIAVVMLASRSGQSVFFIQLPERQYDAAIIVGEGFKIAGPGIKSYLSQDVATLHEELRSFGFHTSTLRKILVLAGMPTANPDEVTSLRVLRRMVFAGTGIPAGTIQNQIMKLLPKLSFQQRPLGVNVSTVKTILELLGTNAGSEIPEDLFMPIDCFFTVDANRTALVICAWGSNPPTFNYSGKPLLATAEKGVGAGKLDAYSPNPPNILQMKRVPMMAAIQGWNTMLEKGFIAGDYSTTTRQARVFSGQDKIQVWRFLNENLAGTIRKPNIIAESSGPSGGSQKRPNEEDPAGKGKKRRIAGFF